MLKDTAVARQLKLAYDAYYNQTYVRDLFGSGFGFYIAGNQSALTNADFIGLTVPDHYNLVGTAGSDALVLSSIH